MGKDVKDFQEEVRDDKLMNFEHEDGGTTKSEKLN
jgi:hypothetical protein